MTDWRPQAACRTARPGSHDERQEAESARTFRVRINNARQICAACPVAPQCLIRAARAQESGVRAGFLLHNGAQVADDDLRFQCGTYPAYRRHIKRGQKPCAACKTAGSEYYRCYDVARQRVVS
jgi:hypothetical protein